MNELLLDDDPFGPDAPLPELKGTHGFKRKGPTLKRDALTIAGDASLDPEKSGLVKGKTAKPKQADHNQRTAQWFRDRGYLYVRTEWFSQRPDGFMWKRDLMGFADGMAFKNGKFFAVQIKSKANMSAAVREMASDAAIKGAPFPTKRQNLDAFMQAGGRVIVIGWEKGERFWECDTKEVKAEDIALVDSRRRKG